MNLAGLNGLRWLAGAFAVLLFAGALLVPQTGWIVLREFRSATLQSDDWRHMLAWAGVTPAYLREGVSAPTPVLREAASTADDGLLIASALFSASGSDRSVMQRLAAAHPRSPAIRAAALRYACRDGMTVQRPDLTAYAGFTTYPGPIAAADSARFLSDASAGTRADPDNAFFPTMQAGALLDLHRDAEAAAALHRASRCERWDDYSLTEVHGIWRLREIAFGHQPVTNLYVGFMTPPGVGALVRAVTRAFVGKAIVLERGGNRAAGLALRLDLLHVGARMRRDSRETMGSSVGMAVEAMAIGLPGGHLHSKAYNEASREDRWAASARDLLRYEGPTAGESVARLVAAEMAKCRDATAIILSPADSDAVLEASLRRGTSAWGLSEASMLAAFWLVVVWALSALIHRLAPRRGIVAAIVTVALIVGVPVLLLQSATPPAGLVELGGTYRFTGDPAPPFWFGPLPAWILSTLVVVAVPLLALLVAVIVRLRKKAPVSGMLARTGAFWCLATAVAYVVAVGYTSAVERQDSAALALRAEHEGRYLSALQHRPWPD